MISIIIRTFNEEKAIGKCLEILLNQTFENYEILIIDSSSTDQTVKIAQKFAHKNSRIKILEIAKQDFTYGKALNFGILNTNPKSKYIVLLSAHAFPSNNFWLSEFHRYIEINSNVAGVFGKQIVFKEHLKNWFVEYQNEFGYHLFYKNESYISSDSYFFSNANAIIRKETWEMIKYDETLPYTEDWKWAKEVLSMGKQIGYLHNAEVLHSHADSLLRYINRRKNEIKGTNNVILGYYSKNSFKGLIKQLIYNNPIALLNDMKNKKYSIGRYFRFLTVKTIDDIIIYINA